MVNIKELKRIIKNYKDSDIVAIEIGEDLYDPIAYDDEYSRCEGEPTLVFLYGKEYKVRRQIDRIAKMEDEWNEESDFFD